MKSGWQAKTLGEVCRIKPPKNEARGRVSADGLVSFLPMEDLGINQKFVRARQAKPLSTVVGSYTYFAEGDVLLAKITPCFENGKLGIAEGLANGVGFGSSEYIVFRPDGTLSKEWLYYYLSREAFRVEGAARMAGAVGHKRVAKEFIESYPIPVPPLPEQQRIVGILDEAFDGIATAGANAEKNLQNARALFESHLQSIFAQRGEGWIEKKLGEVAEVQSGGTPSVSKKEYWGGEIPWYSSGELNNTFTKAPERKVTEAGLRNSNAKLFPKGSLLVGMYDTAALKMSVLDRDGAFNQAVAGVKPNDSVDVEFVLNAINASKPRLLRERRGVRQKNLSLGKIREIAIPLPVVTEQRATVSRLRRVLAETERLESHYQRKLAALEALKKSLLHQAFSGDL
ncbi:MAG: restriction endonuclease subunit S [Chloroflexi bacterium]|nr:restriction endonuclease subunit S [Chloroflexota bacterium]